MVVSVGGLLDPTGLAMPVLSFLVGAAFLLVAVVERIGKLVQITRPYQKWMMGIMGAIFILLALRMHYTEAPAEDHVFYKQPVPESVKTETVVRATGPQLIFLTRPFPGYDMGVNTSGGLTNWVRVDSLGVCMDYPSNQDWGAVFVTVGKPRNSPHPSRDFSAFRRLAVELRGGTGGESIWIGIKDGTDPDDGSETKVEVTNLSTRWTRYEWPLSRFSTADLHHVYVPIEFVFDGPAKQVWFRNVSYLP